MRSFIWYPLVGFFVALLNVLSHITSDLKPFATSINNISLIFHYTFLAIFILRQYENRKLAQLLTPLSFLILVPIIFLLVTNDISKNNRLAFSISGFWLIVICSGYYFGLLSSKQIIDLKLLPVFWIVTGVFFCMSLLIPLTLFLDISFNSEDINWKKYFPRIGMICYGMMHILFIKAYSLAEKEYPKDMDIIQLN